MMRAAVSIFCFVLLFPQPALRAQAVRPLGEILLNLGNSSEARARKIAEKQAEKRWQVDRGPLYKSCPPMENSNGNVLSDEKIFEGRFTPESNKTKLAMFSDDGCDVWIDGTRVLNNFKKPQHLPSLARSFHVLDNYKPVAGKPNHIKIHYSNTIYKGKTDIDGCTLFAFKGGGICDEILITSLSPSEVLELGNDLTIHYRVACPKLEKAELHISNRSGVLVFQGKGLPASAGAHKTTWPKAKWNEKPHAGSFANPANGPYSVQIFAVHEGSSGPVPIKSNVKQLNTLLVINANLTDDKPSKNEIASGIYRPALDPKSPERLRIGLVPAGGGATVFADDPPQFTKIVKADLDNDPSDGLEVKSAHVRQVMQSTFSNGSYKVVMSQLRDLAGNEGAKGTGPEGIFDDWVIPLD